MPHNKIIVKQNQSDPYFVYALLFRDGKYQHTLYPENFKNQLGGLEIHELDLSEAPANFINKDYLLTRVRSKPMKDSKDANDIFPGKCTDIKFQESGGLDKSFNPSGSKYLRRIQGAVSNYIDVYAVLSTFNVICPARQHAIKKLLCSGLREKGSTLQDLKEARDAIDRAIQLHKE